MCGRSQDGSYEGGEPSLEKSGKWIWLNTGMKPQKIQERDWLVWKKACPFPNPGKYNQSLTKARGLFACMLCVCNSPVGLAASWLEHCWSLAVDMQMGKWDTEKFCISELWSSWAGWGYVQVWGSRGWTSSTVRESWATWSKKRHEVPGAVPRFRSNKPYHNRSCPPMRDGPRNAIHATPWKILFHWQQAKPPLNQAPAQFFSGDPPISCDLYSFLCEGHQLCHLVRFGTKISCNWR